MIGRPPQPLEKRFWRRVAKAGADDCWLWTGQLDGYGYGRIGVAGKNKIATRVAWELAHGAEPGDFLICHSCDNPACVNPAHLWLGTAADNMRDMVAKGRQGLRGRARKSHLLSKLTEAEARRIKFGGERISDVAAALGIPHSTASAIRRGISWAWLEPETNIMRGYPFRAGRGRNTPAQPHHSTAP